MLSFLSRYISSSFFHYDALLQECLFDIVLVNNPSHRMFNKFFNGIFEVSKRWILPFHRGY